MTTFQELDAYLSQDFSDDYWADDASLYARELVKQLTTEDWNTLKSSWQNRPKQWQVSCAEILDWGEAQQAVPLLLEMIREGDDELTLTAADSLRSIGVAELDLPVGEDVLERLQAVAQTGNIAKRIISELLEQLQVKAYHDFLIEVLQATEESGADPQVVYPLLEANQEKLDNNFAQLLRSWATATLSELEAEQTLRTAVAIGNLSNLIREFRRGDRASNLEIAITGYEVVATVFTHQAFPDQWATMQNNIGIAYSERIKGERAENIEVAIRCFSSALEVRTRQAFPKQWAVTQNNLGTAYLNRIWGERAENIEVAIRCFSSALEVQIHQTFPQDWAATQKNLGAAYYERIRGERTENIELAIRCFSSALEVRTRQAFPKQWAAIQNNLGNAYSNRIRGKRAENIEVAICCFSSALEVRTRQVFPEQWAATQNNLGNAYLNRIHGERAENLEAAICCFSAALEVRTREAFPQDWADTQNNLGVAYFNRIQEERAENLEAAIHCFSSVLEVHTRQAFPQNHAKTQFNLGLAYRDAQQFSKAYNAFASAIDTVEFLRGEIVSGDEAKQKLAEEWNLLYQGAVEVCLELHDYAKAIEYVERSQARNLVELLANPELYPEGNIPAEIPNELAHLRKEITHTPQLIDMEVERRRRGILTWQTA